MCGVVDGPSLGALEACPSVRPGGRLSARRASRYLDRCFTTLTHTPHAY